MLLIIYNELINFRSRMFINQNIKQKSYYQIEIFQHNYCVYQEVQ